MGTSSQRQATFSAGFVTLKSVKFSGTATATQMPTKIAERAHRKRAHAYRYRDMRDRETRDARLTVSCNKEAGTTRSSNYTAFDGCEAKMVDVIQCTNDGFSPRYRAHLGE
jgi:hypothetical protein